MVKINHSAKYLNHVLGQLSCERVHTRLIVVHGLQIGRYLQRSIFGRPGNRPPTFSAHWASNVACFTTFCLQIDL